jgi:PncC family amidohydrolase
LVLAESCTAGLVPALLASVPGISDYLCGSMVAYRAECKRDWLGIDPDEIEQHSAVSPAVSRQLATTVLQRTPIADYSAAVTGHLGPDAPPALDGRIFIAVARRHDGRVELHDEADFQLVAAERTARQLEAAQLVLRTLIKTVSADSSTQADKT